MGKASISDLHSRTSELVRAAAEGAVIVIERRGEPVAELRPIAKDRAKMRRKVLAEMRRLWKKMPQLDGDSGRWLEENR